MIAAAFYPKDVIVRLSDFKTNEYASLVGGRAFEPAEENPMLGFRGASRYYDPRYRDGLRARVPGDEAGPRRDGADERQADGPVLPDRRGRASASLAEMAEHGLERGENGLEVYVMCEIPSNVILAERVRRDLRRLLDRLQRPDPAHPGRRPRLGDRRPRLRRAQPGRA